MVYFAAMTFSTFYHTCDEATSSYADFPSFLDTVCARLFVDHQVLQVNMFSIEECHIPINILLVTNNYSFVYFLPSFVIFTLQLYPCGLQSLHWLQDYPMVVVFINF